MLKLLSTGSNVYFFSFLLQVCEEQKQQTSSSWQRYSWKKNFPFELVCGQRNHNVRKLKLIFNLHVFACLNVRPFLIFSSNLVFSVFFNFLKSQIEKHPTQCFAVYPLVLVFHIESCASCIFDQHLCHLLSCRTAIYTPVALTVCKINCYRFHSTKYGVKRNVYVHIHKMLINTKIHVEKHIHCA